MHSSGQGHRNPKKRYCPDPIANDKRDRWYPFKDLVFQDDRPATWDPAGRTNLASPDHASREWTSKGSPKPILQLNRRTSWNSPADGPVSLRFPVAHMAA
jgi:hypothetical protein